jgi:methionine--tRNA ligase beta chain
MDEVKIDDFQKLDIRIGTITKAEIPEWSHWVTKLTVDLGDEIGERTVFAGIMKQYKPEEVEGRQAPFIVNLKPKKIGPAGDYSCGMMMMASVSHESGDPEKEEPIFLNLDKKVPNGTKVS